MSAIRSPAALADEPIDRAGLIDRRTRFLSPSLRTQASFQRAAAKLGLQST